MAPYQLKESFEMYTECLLAGILKQAGSNQRARGKFPEEHAYLIDM